MAARHLVLYLLAVAIISVYGTEVCPFLDSMTIVELSAVAVIGLLGALGLRALLAPRLLTRAPMFALAGRRFWVEFIALVGAGALAGASTMLGWGFPLGSAAKLVLGFTTLGLFTALALALDEEYLAIRGAMPAPALPPDGFTSIARRFLLVSLALAGFTAAILLLIVSRDLTWLASLDKEEWGEAKVLVLVEIVFVIAIISAYIALLTVRFARNLRMFLELELATMEEVSHGRYERRVPVGSSTEFGHIAFYTNQMIEGLKERDQIRDVFGKMVSPTLSKRLLEDAESLVHRAGSRANMVILFSDVRDFTRRTESADPATLVRDLNLYFERMVEVIHREQGVVDKFIGDGIMAIFGLTDEQTAPDRAVRAALGMQAALAGLQGELEEPIKMGIGVHAGEVIAGAIGAPERLEFTVIGDPVNTAARLEARTKELGVGILISEAIHSRLEGDLRARAWQHLGQQQLKGKRVAVDVYGL